MKPLLPLCSTPVAVTRDGNTGSQAKLLLPFVGYWFASGAQYAFPNAVIAQSNATTIHGTTMADTFAKTCCDSCSGAGVAVGPT
jgi:hypothetical protein